MPCNMEIDGLHSTRWGAGRAAAAARRFVHAFLCPPNASLRSFVHVIGNQFVGGNRRRRSRKSIEQMAMGISTISVRRNGTHAVSLSCPPSHLVLCLALP